MRRTWCATRFIGVLAGSLRAPVYSKFFFWGGFFFGECVLSARRMPRGNVFLKYPLLHFLMFWLAADQTLWHRPINSLTCKRWLATPEEVYMHSCCQVLSALLGAAPRCTWPPRRCRQTLSLPCRSAALAHTLGCVLRPALIARSAELVRGRGVTLSQLPHTCGQP